MKFEHLIEINSPNNPNIPLLTREQLWRALILRAEEPIRFIEHLDKCEITERSEASIKRTLNYGTFSICDRVTYLAPHQVHYLIEEQGEIPRSTLTVTIEEPDQEHFFIRFAYEDESMDDGINAMYNSFRRSAYKEADIDFVRLIRIFAQEGKL